MMVPKFRWLVWLLLLAIATVTLSPLELRPATGMPADIERACAYAVLGSILFVAYPKHRQICMVLAIGFAGILEVGQHFVPGRHGTVHDFVIKALSVIVGMLTVWSLERIRRPR
jgi:VanZ family protein